jgi:alkylation response protein AidB-like acyl-CoA dehydrogenase
MSDSERHPAVGELESWLVENWDTTLTLREWWQRLGLSGWSAATLPRDAFGRGVPREVGIQLAQAIVRAGALGPPGGLGLLLAAPTLAQHGTQRQKDRYLAEIVTGTRSWCQLFSEPGAGSDLAGLTTTAVPDGDEWVVNGQKVWTSAAHQADYGMLLARTDPDAPKHRGISYFAVAMDQPGLEIRPLREMTGRAMFNEVFLTDVRVRHDDAIGGINNGWGVANTTLGFERSGLSAGGGAGGVFGAAPGEKVGALDRGVAEYLETRRKRPSRGPRLTHDLLVNLAQTRGQSADLRTRQDLAQLYVLSEVARMTNLRAKALREVGRSIPGQGNLGKLAMSAVLRLQRDVSLRIVGPAGTLHGYTAGERAALEGATGDPALGSITEAALFAQGPPIYGGTDEIQRNIIAERVLGLPREPNNEKDTPFRELPRNA